MKRETKFGLLIGLAVILLIGIIVSDQLSQPAAKPAPMQDFARGSNGASDRRTPVAPTPGNNSADPLIARTPAPQTPEVAPRPIPTPGDLEHAQAVHDNALAQSGATSSDPLQRIAEEVRRANLEQAAKAEQGAGAHGLNTGTTGNLPGAGQVPPSIQPLDPIVPQGSKSAGANPPAPLPTPRLATHKVEPRQSLYQIAIKYYNDGDQWKLIRDANTSVVDKDGNVREGVTLTIPAAPTKNNTPAKPEQPAIGGAVAKNTGSSTPTATAKVIKVEPRDTLSSLADKHLGSSAKWQALLDANRDQLKSPDQLQPGMMLKLPTGQAASTPAPASTAPRTAATNNSSTAPAPAGNKPNLPYRTYADVPPAVREQLGLTPASFTNTPVVNTPAPKTTAKTAGNTDSTPAPRTTPAVEKTETYEVKPGDTLVSIARKTMGDGNLWKKIFDANRKTLKSPEDLEPGQKLIIPAAKQTSGVDRRVAAS